MTINSVQIAGMIVTWSLIQFSVFHSLNAYGDEFTHIAFSGENEIVSRKSADVQTSFTVPYSIEDLQIQASPSGKIAYLESTEYRRISSPSPWTVEKKEEQPDQFMKSYKVDAIPLILHVCEANGTEIKRIPIAQRYGCNFRNLVYYGENVIGLKLGGHRVSQAAETFIDLRTEKIFSLHYEAGYSMWRNCPSPDGNTFLLSVEMENGNLPSLLIANGRMVYPFLEKEAPFASDNPEEFDKKMVKIRRYAEDRKKQGKTIPAYFGMSDAMWSEDGRSFVLLERDNERYRLLKFNLDAIASDKPFEEYCKPLREIPSPEKDFSQEYGGLMGIRIVYDSKTEEVRLESRQKYLEKLKKEKVSR
jgi:hypothetical protein